LGRADKSSGSATATGAKTALTCSREQVSRQQVSLTAFWIKGFQPCSARRGTNVQKYWT
jgi:hypothetical protein